MSEAVVSRLPRDFVLETSGGRSNNMQIRLYMTLETVTQAQALREVIDLGIIPILELYADTRPDLTRDAVAADLGFQSLAENVVELRRA